MRTLYLTRHAKSSWNDPHTDDFDRILNERGLRDAPFMATAFAKRGEPVDRIISSPAARAITTAKAFAAALRIPEDRIIQKKEIYLAPVELLVRMVNFLPDDVHRVMLFGHNPGFSDLAQYLGGGDIGEMPTCATVRFDLDVDSWSETSIGVGSLTWYDHPKQHVELV